jgi:hypothetical protein
MDGAATHHITPNKHAFSFLETTEIPQLTQVAGPTAAAGKGTVRLAVKQPQKQLQIVELREVLSQRWSCEKCSHNRVPAVQ